MSALTAKAMVQEAFLEHLHQSAEAVTVFLVNGVKLQGVVADFDADSILLRRDGHIQLVYKHAMSTIMPVASLSNFIIELTASPAVAAGDF